MGGGMGGDRHGPRYIAVIWIFATRFTQSLRSWAARRVPGGREAGNSRVMSSRAPPTLAEMRLRATGLLFAMAILFIAAKLLEQQNEGFGYLRAFAEAALVGGLADWFAVTALFRRPLGLPIPHTAIVPRSKDRIGEGLARFLETNFLRPEIVTARLRTVDLAGGAARWLMEPGRAEQAADMVFNSAPRALDSLNDARIGQWVQEFASDRIRKTDIAGLAGDALAVLTAQGRHHGLVDLVIARANLALNDEEASLRLRVRERTDWFSRLLSVDVKAADALVGALRDTLQEAAFDPGHPIRTQVDDALEDLVADLRQSPALRADVARWTEAILGDPVIQKYLRGVWTDLKASLAARGPQERAAFTEALVSGLRDLADAVLDDADLRETVNGQMRAWLERMVEAHGADVAHLVSDTIKGWDARTVVDQLEAGVGRDLQYIRISGTLIGGLVGLTLHALSDLIF